MSVLICSLTSIVSGWTYAIKEVSAPENYLLNDKVFYAQLKVADDLVRFEVLNNSMIPDVSIEKHGNMEVLAGDSMSYDFRQSLSIETIISIIIVWVKDINCLSICIISVHDNIMAIPSRGIVIKKVRLNTKDNRMPVH